MTNAEVAQKLRDLRDFLLIAGYEESHAVRYTSVARQIEQMGEPVEHVMRQGRLRDLPGVGPVIARYIREIIVEGKASKQADWEHETPYSVIELLKVPGIGVRIAQALFRYEGIRNLAELQQAIREGRLDDLDFLGDKVRAAALETIL